MRSFSEGWVAVDFDGTLATYERNQWPALGQPIKPMVDLVKKYLAEGTQVRIMTARAGNLRDREAIQDWCAEHIGEILPITNAKDFLMIRLYDDRAIQVETNTGRLIEDV